MKTIQTMLVLSLATATTLLACGGANPGPAVAGTSPVEPGTSNAQAADKAVVDKLANARCDQEQTCKNIAPGAKFASREICMDQIRGTIGNDLNTYKCPKGLNSEGVDRCMAAVKSEECSHPFDTLTRYDKCRDGALCMN